MMTLGGGGGGVGASGGGGDGGQEVGSSVSLSCVDCISPFSLPTCC